MSRNENDKNGDEDTVVKEIYIAATAEDIFPYLTSPRQHASWMGVDARIDAQPSGTYQIDFNGVDAVIGEYLEVDPLRRLRFACIGRDYAVPDNPSTVEILSCGNGTLPRVTHHDPDREGHDRYRGGSGYHLARFALVLAGKDPGPDPKADLSYRHHCEA